MCAYLLTCFRGAEYPDDRDPRRRLILGGIITAKQSRIEFGRFCLVIINAVEADTKRVHEKRLIERWESGCMVETSKQNGRQADR